MGAGKRLLFSPGFPPSIGGQQNYIYARCRAYPENLDVIAAYFDGWEAFDKAQNFRVHRFSYPWQRPHFEPLRRVVQIYRSTKVLRPFLSSGIYDVVEVSTVFPGVIAALLSPGRKHFKLLSYALGDDVLRPLMTPYAAPFFKYALKRVDMFVAISNYTKSLLVKAGVPSEKIVVIYPPVDHERFSRRGDPSKIKSSLPPHDFLLLSVTRLVKKKGVDTVISLLPSLKKRFPGLLYVVGGDGEDRERLEALTYQFGVEDSVIFLGRVPSDILIDLYAAADLFVLPTREDARTGSVEGFGIVFLEAGSQEVPVIGPNRGGSADAIIHGRTGYLVDPYDPADIERRIVELLHRPDLRARFGKAGRERALRPTDWSPILGI